MDHPVLELECAFMTVDYLLGILIIATVVGGISETIAKTSAERDAFRHRLDSVKNYLRIRHVDGRLERRPTNGVSYPRSLKCTPEIMPRTAGQLIGTNSEETN